MVAIGEQQARVDLEWTTDRGATFELDLTDDNGDPFTVGAVTIEIRRFGFEPTPTHTLNATASATPGRVVITITPAQAAEIGPFIGRWHLAGNTPPIPSVGGYVYARKPSAT